MSKVFFDIAIDGQPAGRIEFVLYNDVVPKTTENFRYNKYLFIYIIIFIK